MLEKEDFDEILISLDDRAFLGYLALKTLIDTKSKKISKHDLDLIFSSYSLLLIERKNYLEVEKKLTAINGFMGLR